MSCSTAAVARTMPHFWGRCVPATRKRFAQSRRPHHASLVRVARQYVPTREIAEDVAQDAWIGLLRGLDTFEGRSSLRTYLFRIVMNLARTRGVREARSAPFSSLGARRRARPLGRSRALRAGAGQSARATGSRRSGPGAAAPSRSRSPDEALQVVYDAIAELPETQRRVVTLRDVEGFDADDVCDLLELSEGNQRVLLAPCAHEAAPGARGLLRMTGTPYHEPTCQELAELITDYLEGVLAPEQHELFDLHISDCPDCTLYVEQMRTTILTAGRVRVDDIPPPCAQNCSSRSAAGLPASPDEPRSRSVLRISRRPSCALDLRGSATGRTQRRSASHDRTAEALRPGVALALRESRGVPGRGR